MAIVATACWPLLTTSAQDGFSATNGSRIHREQALPYKPRVVVVTTFPGEYAHWSNRLPLGIELPFPASAGGMHLGWNDSLRIMGVVTGMGPKRAAMTITALGHDPRFNLTESYWVLAGIAGADPAVCTVGSAAWATYLVDAEFAFYIDPREAPSDWPTGFVPWNRSIPYGPPLPSRAEVGDIVHMLNATLARWAFNLTKDIVLPDSPALQRLRAPYAKEYRDAGRRPVVLQGDVLDGALFWMGKLSASWARNWTRYYTNNAAAFTMSSMEDLTIAMALSSLARAGRVQSPSAKYLVLRTSSNFVEPPSDIDAASFLADPNRMVKDAAFEAAYMVGAPVVFALAASHQIVEKQARPIVDWGVKFPDVHI